LLAQFRDDVSKIDGTFSSLKGGVEASSPHDDWAAGVNKETDAVAQDVLNAWKTLYQEQKDKVFVWPKELGADFLGTANQLGSDPNAYIPRKLREYYQSMVKQQVARLADIVDAPSADEGDSEKVHVVDWSQTSQKEIEEAFDWSQSPT